MPRLLTRVAAAATLAMLVSGCALITGRTTIQELKYNPGRYHDRKVAIDGIVTRSWGLPLVPFKLYKVDDGTGRSDCRVTRGPDADARRARSRDRTRQRGRDVRGIERRAAHSGDRPRLQTIDQIVSVGRQETDLDFRR